MVVYVVCSVYIHEKEWKNEKNELAVENGNYRRGVDQRDRQNVYVLYKTRDLWYIFFSPSSLQFFYINSCSFFCCCVFLHCTALHERWGSAPMCLWKCTEILSTQFTCKWNMHTYFFIVYHRICGMHTHMNAILLCSTHCKNFYHQTFKILINEREWFVSKYVYFMLMRYLNYGK